MKKLLFTFALSVFLFIGAITAQKGSINLNFSGIDATSTNTIALDSVIIENITMGCDTTVYGAEPILFYEWLGIDDLNTWNRFTIGNCYPNPFTESTRFTVASNDLMNADIQLVSYQGVLLAEIKNMVIVGSHAFEITGLKCGVYILMVNNATQTITQKLTCFNRAMDTRVQLNYLGPDNSFLKSSREVTSFVFQPGNQLKFTAYSSGYINESIVDSPTENKAYEFEMNRENENIYTQINEGFDDVIQYEEINLPDWKNIAESGNMNWFGQIHNDENFAQATVENSSDEENVIWLISPLCDFDAGENNNLTFISAQSGWTHYALTVWYVQNLIGNHIINAETTELPCTLPNQYTPENEWVESGTVDLSSFTGLGRIGFRYEGSVPNGATTKIRVDDVQINSSFDPEVIEFLTGGSSKSWYWAADQPGHAGLGPNSDDFGNMEYTWPSWWQIAPFDPNKACMYDAEFVFTKTYEGMTFEQITGPAFIPGTYADKIGVEGDICYDETVAWPLYGVKNVTLSASTSQASIDGGYRGTTMNFSDEGFMCWWVGTSEYDIIEVSETELKVRIKEDNDFAWYHTFTNVNPLSSLLIENDPEK